MHLSKVVLEANSAISELQAQLSSMPVVEDAKILPELLPECRKDEKIKVLQAEINAFEPVNNDDLISQKRELNATRDTLNKEIAKEATIEAYKAEIKRLNETASDLAQQIADLETRVHNVQLRKFASRRLKRE